MTDLDRVRELREKQAEWRQQGESLKQELAEAVTEALQNHSWKDVAAALGVTSKERVYQIRRGTR
ncbi:DNA binding protein [Mycobacterium phage Cornie]|uniref:DNA binding protein n=1 Tax=Mycobacterium phage Cornie TaxID=2704043 RepID=A0A6G6XJX6_9CAUD|nr:DNA binding protein [Mycobacterium phage Cornie]QIG58402.1 DNA binding protein [Mycobacterium phage Cornie]